MPIRPENRDRYPANWKAISQQVRDGAGNICQRCGAPNGVMIRRGKTRDGRAVWRLASDSAYEDGRCAETGARIEDTSEDTCDWGDPVKVILTVAHLDHEPENCDPENLRAWCQRCHNAYDAPMRRAGISARRKSERASGDLFGGMKDGRHG